MTKRPTGKVIGSASTAPIAFAPDLEFIVAVDVAEKTFGHLFAKADFSEPYVEAGLVDVNPALGDGVGIATRLTDAGRALLPQVVDKPTVAASATAPAPASASAPQFEFDLDVPIAAVKRGGGRKEGGSKYPFDAMPVGASIHIPAFNDKTVAETAKSIASTVSQFNLKYAVELPEQEIVTETIYQIDANGKRVKVDGHYVKTGSRQVTRAKLRFDRSYTVRTVDASDKRGPGVRVFREA